MWRPSWFSAVGLFSPLFLAHSPISLQKVKIGDQVLFDTATDGKPVAFKLGQRPFQNVVCAGLEEGLLGMRVGGRRLLVVPPALAPPGVGLPADVTLTYDVTLTEVLNNYF